MNTDEYIRGEIIRHLDTHKITYREAQIAEMVQSVLGGTGAFHIIFDQVFDPFCEAGDEIYLLDKWSPLDRSLIRETTTQFGTLYAYDGNRYQWSEMETILIDQAALRDIKISELGL